MNENFFEIPASDRKLETHTRRGFFSAAAGAIAGIGSTLMFWKSRRVEASVPTSESLPPSTDWGKHADSVKLVDIPDTTKDDFVDADMLAHKEFTEAARGWGWDDEEIEAYLRYCADPEANPFPRAREERAGTSEPTAGRIVEGSTVSGDALIGSLSI